MQQANSIQKHFSEIKTLMQAHGVQKAYAFGTAVKGNLTANSDVDFIIRFRQNMNVETYTDNYFSMACALKNLLNKKVELTAKETLSNPYLIQSIC